MGYFVFLLQNGLLTEQDKNYIANMLFKCGISNCKYVWHSENSKKTCSKCASLDGKVYNFYDEIPERIHPNCRCWVGVMGNETSNQKCEEIKNVYPYEKPKSKTKDWIMPCKGVISSKYGSRSAPKNGASTNHNGWDIKCPVGTSIVAINDGTVIAAGVANGYGQYVVIDHVVINGTRVTSEYGHISSWSVKVGQRVSKGEEIAKSGNSGISTGPHLHITIRHGKYRGESVDPSKYLDY